MTHALTRTTLGSKPSLELFVPFQCVLVDVADVGWSIVHDFFNEGCIEGSNGPICVLADCERPHLLEVMEPSGIVSAERILETCKAHSLCMEKVAPPPHKKTKRVCWESSNQSDSASSSTDKKHQRNCSNVDIWDLEHTAFGQSSWLPTASMVVGLASKQALLTEPHFSAKK
jgi:hypothetical protein